MCVNLFKIAVLNTLKIPSFVRTGNIRERGVGRLNQGVANPRGCKRIAYLYLCV
jgi:hypothetical protein